MLTKCIGGTKVKRHGGFSLGAHHLPQESDTHPLKTQQSVHSKVTDKIVWEHQKKGEIRTEEHMR